MRALLSFVAERLSTNCLLLARPTADGGCPGQKDAVFAFFGIFQGFRGMAGRFTGTNKSFIGVAGRIIRAVGRVGHTVGRVNRMAEGSYWCG
jgi:hypothetical protein